MASSTNPMENFYPTIRKETGFDKIELHFASGNYVKAQQTWQEAAETFVKGSGGSGLPLRLPLTAEGHDGGVIVDAYKELHPAARAMAMECCIGVARCYVKWKDLESALAWLQEAIVLQENTKFANERAEWEWMNSNIDFVPMTQNHVTALSEMADIYILLGNTAMAHYCCYRADANYTKMPARHNTPKIMRGIQQKMAKLMKLHHPDPKLTPKLELQDPGLQIRGSWEKLSVKAGRIEARTHHASFIWNGHLFVAGGRLSGLGPFYRDLWTIDLAKLDRWVQLDSYPVPFSTSSAFIGWTMLVHEDKAYLFTGRPDLDYYDLHEKKWGSVRTTYQPTAEDKKAGIRGSWFYPKYGRGAIDSTQQIVRGKLYVFGGTHDTTSIGCNLFMELDLETKIWRRLDGEQMPVNPRWDLPSPRKTPVSWVNSAQDRIYLMGGECDRTGASLTREPHGADEGFVYPDMWSWNIDAGRWRRERISGNPPCARSEVAYCFNPVLGKAVLWGGYSPTQPTRMGDKVASFSYFADTFIFDDSPSTNPSSSLDPAPKWKQVLTRGFPTYRCQAHLLADPDTGKMYMFGGFTNTTFVPECRQAWNKGPGRSFGDLWQLKIDMQGGCFEGVDLAEEARTATNGPWRRCYNCSSAGSWKKCGGSCRGRVFFCGPECMKEGWKEHKTTHGCAKLT